MACPVMQVADVWSCGVMLFIMLAATYPFGRPEDEQLKPSKKMHVMLQVRASLMPAMQQADAAAYWMGAHCAVTDTYLQY